MNTQEYLSSTQYEYQTEDEKNILKKEKMREYNRAYYQRNRERLLRYQNDYNHRNKFNEEHSLTKQQLFDLERKEFMREYQKEYRRKNAVVLREKQRISYVKNRYLYCYRTINKYAPKAIDKVRSICPDVVNEYYKRYPFEDFAERVIKYRLRKSEIYPSQARYDDCYDACVLAYLYSIHRCAYLGVDYVNAYMRKMINIYMFCALVIYDDVKNLCKANNFSTVYVDAEYSHDRY